MKNINWKVRLKHKPFLVALFSALVLFVQQVAAAFGFDTTVYNEQVSTIFFSLLGILVLLGVVIDPTTKNISDSDNAKQYKEPK